MISQIVGRSWSHTFVVTSLVVAICTCATFGDVKLPAIISDNMVLQAGDANVWGWAAPGEEVIVRLGPDPKNKPNQIISRSARADGDGCWAVTMTPATPSLFGGQPMKLVVTGKNEQVVKNVVIGEVWICSGQSNMEWTGKPVSKKSSSKYQQMVMYPNIRMFKVAHVSTAQKRKMMCYRIAGVVSTPETVPQFSARWLRVFADELHRSALGEPVGMISTNWGGSASRGVDESRATLRKINGA